MRVLTSEHVPVSINVASKGRINFGSGRSTDVGEEACGNLKGGRIMALRKWLLYGVPVSLAIVGLIVGLAVFWPSRSSQASAPRPVSLVPSVCARLASIPRTIRAGGPTIQFTATLTNHGSTTQHDVAPLIQIVGGPCNCALGSLERFESSSSTWQATPMPEGDGDPNFLARATGGITLRPGASVTFRYRLRLSAANPAKPVRALLYAVQLPAGTQLALISVPTRITKG